MNFSQMCEITSKGKPMQRQEHCSMSLEPGSPHGISKCGAVKMAGVKEQMADMIACFRIVGDLPGFLRSRPVLHLSCQLPDFS
jgi:hypothetical protein